MAEPVCRAALSTASKFNSSSTAVSVLTLAVQMFFDSATRHPQTPTLEISDSTSPATLQMAMERPPGTLSMRPRSLCLHWWRVRNVSSSWQHAADYRFEVRRVRAHRSRMGLLDCKRLRAPRRQDLRLLAIVPETYS